MPSHPPPGTGAGAAGGGLSRTLAWALALSLGCVPSPGPFRLPEAHGLVADSESGVPVAGAEVFEWYTGAPTGGAGSAPVYHARWTTAGEDGRFELPGGVAPSPRMWLLRTYGPRYAFYAPGYGYQRGARTGPSGELRLPASRPNAPQGLRDLAPFCRGERRDAGSRHLARIACPQRPSRPPAARDPRDPGARANPQE